MAVVNPPGKTEVAEAPKTDPDKTEAAKVLGIGTRTLYRRLAEYGEVAAGDGDGNGDELAAD